MVGLTLVATLAIAKVQWRGVHLFVGPNALEFHKQLWTNVLLPLGYNKVVLQCEQTEWKCLPNLKGGISMQRDDLAKLCEWYRSKGGGSDSFGPKLWACPMARTRKSIP